MIYVALFIGGAVFGAFIMGLFTAGKMADLREYKCCVDFLENEVDKLKEQRDSLLEEKQKEEHERGLR
ncbi:MAG: hypothetical protein PHX83_11900 [Acidobacteriia bacterium]|nr:hypothetical protein [Terriglobia bacterium]